MILLKTNMIRRFYSEIEKNKFSTARELLKLIDENLILETKYFNKSNFVIIRLSYYCTDNKQLINLKRNCSDNLLKSLFFNKLEFQRFYYNLLLENKEYKEIERTMSGCLTSYDPVLYNIYGKYNLEIDEFEKAIKFIFLSGIYDKETEKLVSLFQNRFKNSHKNQFLGIIPRTLKLTSTRSILPNKLKEKLVEIGVPTWFIK